MFTENTPFEYCTKVEYNNVTLLKGCCHLLLNIEIYNPSLNLKFFGKLAGQGEPKYQ
jgi:hypothetical protein